MNASSNRSAFFRLAALNVLSNITVPLVGLVDVALLGHRAEVRHLAGVGLAALLFDYIYWSFGFLRMGTTGLAAQATGREDRTELYDVLYRALLIGGVSGLAILLLREPLADIGFGLLSGAAEVETAGRQYFSARVLGAPAALLQIALLGWFLGRAQSGRALAVTVCANLVNLIASYYLIVHRDLAATGAGLGSALSQYAGTGLALLLLLRSRPWPPFQRHRVFARHRLLELFALNRDILIRTICLVSSFAIFTNSSALLGTTVLAANTVLLRVLSLGAYLIDGLAFAVETLAGVLFGRGDTDGLREARRFALGSGLLLAASVLAPITLFPKAMLGVLTRHETVRDLAAGSAFWLIPVLGIGALAYVYDGYFLGLSQGRILRKGMLISTLLVFLPATAWAVARQSNDWLWFAMALFMTARVATLAPRVREVE